MKKLILALTIIVVLAGFYGCQSPEMTSAKVYLQQKDFPAALQQLKLEIKKNPTNAEAYFLAGQIYGDMDSLEQMIAMFKKAEELDTSYKEEIRKWRMGKSAESLKKGIKAYKKKDLDNAINWTILAIKVDDKNIDAWKNLGFLYQEKMVVLSDKGLEDSVKYYSEKRLEAYKHAYELNPKDEENARIYGGFLLEKGLADSALKVIKPFLTESKSAELNLLAADIYRHKNDTSKSLEHLKRATQLQPDNPKILFDIGVIYYNLENFDEAMKYFKKVLELQPDNLDAKMNYILCLFYAKKYQDAERELINLLEKQRDNKDAWEILSITWGAQKKTKKAKIADQIFKALSAGEKEKADELIKKLKLWK